MGPDGKPVAGQAVLCALVLVLVLAQRFALPLSVGQVPLTVPLLLLVAWVGWRQGVLRLDAVRCRLFGAAVVATTAVTVLAVTRGLNPSLLSLLLFVAVYVPALMVAVDVDAVNVALRLFVDLMVFFAALGTALFGLQYVGLQYRDYFGQIVPEQFIQQGYNTADPLRYGDPIYRSNGVIFLEPSFFSLFLALALVVALVLRHRLWATPLLAAAMATTQAGNGLLFVGVALVVMALHPAHRRMLAVLVPALLVAAAVAGTTQLGSRVVDRVSEFGKQGSSANGRMVEPYQLLPSASLETTSGLLWGHGAGSAEAYISAHSDSDGVLTPAGPKLLYEFGILTTVVVLCFLGWTLLAGSASLLWVPPLLVAYLFVNAALQQPTLAALAYVFAAVLGPPLVRAVQVPAPEAEPRVEVTAPC